MIWGPSRPALQSVIDAERAVNEIYRSLVDAVSTAVQPRLLNLPIDNLTEFEGPDEEAIEEPGTSSRTQVTIYCSASRAITLTITLET